MSLGRYKRRKFKKKETKVPVTFIYRNSDKAITKRVEFTGYTSDGVPQGRTINEKGVALGVKELSAPERRAWKTRLPGQMMIEMGYFMPYANVHDHVTYLDRLVRNRSAAPSRRFGRGRTVELSFAGDRLPNFRHIDTATWPTAYF